MAGSVKYGSLPFQEQTDFFRQKINLRTASWTDIFDGQHARAFVVAGAMREDLLKDLRAAVEKAIAGGGTMQQFRKEFDEIVARTGWVYNGGRNWRTRVIYETNLNSSYMAGRYAQLQQVTRTRPYWRYKHSPWVLDPREEHLGWNNMVLRHDDPFWSTHYPPNGWGCQCRVESLSERDLLKLGKDGPDTAPPIELEERTVGVRGPSPRTVRVPKGIDPGFGFNIGEAAQGRSLTSDAMQAWRDQGAEAWESLTPKTWKDFARPARIPLDEAVASTTQPAASPDDMRQRVREAIGGVDQRTYDVKGVPITVRADQLAEHLTQLGRASYLPLLEETLSDPFEVWAAFEKHKGTDRVVMRVRVVKAFALDRERALLVVANAVGGELEAWTIIPADLGYAQRQRRGQLVWGRS